MSNLKVYGVGNLNDYKELVRMFFPNGNEPDELCRFQVPAELLNPVEKKDDIKKALYKELTEITGRTLKWGTLTGVKPLKLYDKVLDKSGGSEGATRKILRNEYLISEEKIRLLEEIHHAQNKTLGAPKENEVSVYIGIPFCPTRCTYCSFTSNQSDYSEVVRYLDALYKELDYVSGEMKRLGLKAESVYVGGGTPTTLETEELKKLVTSVNERIPTIDDFEFTVEAGRPDTITDIKLTMLYINSVNRISINPQTMNDNTLKAIGRNHGVNEVRTAFETSKGIDFRAVNTDVITGLPGESEKDFASTMDDVLAFGPENITVHTLALKKSSKLMDGFLEKGIDPLGNAESITENMVGQAAKMLADKGYRPYYIYRQKYMADNLENVGYAKPGTECIYNIRIMEEKQTVIGIGAGGSSKVYFPDEDRLERVMNVSNYEIYIDRIDEMIDRKRKKLFW